MPREVPGRGRTEEDGPRGAYGFALRGVEGAEELLVDAPASWPLLEVVRTTGSEAPPLDRLGDDRAELRLHGGGCIRIARSPLRATFATPSPLADAELVHPLLGAAAAVAAHWLGREAFHAGAVLLDRGAWGLVGERGTGKSSTLAWLGLHGADVLSDDLLVLEATTVFAGPRSVDLRAEPAAQLGAGEHLGRLGSRERWRVRLSAVPPELPLRGWVLLGWGDRLDMRRLPGGVRLTELARQRAVKVPPLHPQSLLELAALPAWELRRPRRWSSLEEAAGLLLGTVEA
ncbi:MAG: hypothetical protein ACRDOS_00140 [Gaiellaceae bacterium]